MHWFHRLPVLARVIIFLGLCETLVFLCDIVTGFFSFKGPLFINLLLCLLLLAMTHMFLRTEGLSWTDAGLSRSRSALIHLMAGTLSGIGMLIMVASAIKFITGFRWELNPEFTWTHLPAIFATVFCSVFAQELAFRGYPFFLMLRKWGEWPAQLATAFFFGCMHLGEGMSWQEMLLTMFTTGLGSLVFGMATIRTGQLYLAIGIHFGWNLFQYLLPRSLGENGTGIWLVKGGDLSTLGLFTYVAPYVVMIALVYFILKYRRGSLSVE